MYKIKYKIGTRKFVTTKSFKTKENAKKEIRQMKRIARKYKRLYGRRVPPTTNVRIKKI